jgi:RNA polymerase sigma-70 factor (ECF subfamily)
VEAKELAEAIGRFLDTVPYMERKVFLMRYFDLAKIQDIAHQFQMSSGKVKSMLHRTRSKLRIALQKEGY